MYVKTASNEIIKVERRHKICLHLHSFSGRACDMYGQVDQQCIRYYKICERCHKVLEGPSTISRI